jgi:hypothetical protein
MKVYAVIERCYIDSEEITNIMGIFSSETKANSVIEDLEEEASDNQEYECVEYELDKIWYELEVEEEDDDT